MNVHNLGGEAEFGPLVEAAQSEGFSFVERAQLELSVGIFDKPRTVLLGRFVGAQLVGIGGLTPDPYPDAEPGTGRFRHLYVLPPYRRQGVGKRLVTAILEAARQHYRTLRLRTDTPGAAYFYEALGFYACAQPNATHSSELGLLEPG